MSESTTSEATWNTESILCLDNETINKLIEACRVSPRHRYRLCAHHNSEAHLHEMIIVLSDKTYIRPHRHINKPESFHIIKGELEILLFNDSGELTKIIPMAPYESGRVFYYRLDKTLYHTVRVKSEFVVIHETTNGPFIREQTEYAPWSPDENDTDSVNSYRHHINKLKM